MAKIFLNSLYISFYQIYHFDLVIIPKFRKIFQFVIDYPNVLQIIEFSNNMINAFNWQLISLFTIDNQFFDFFFTITVFLSDF